MNKLLICFGHSLLMVFFNIIYLNSNWIAPVEEDLVIVFTEIETFFIHPNNATENIINQTLFINTSNAMALAEINNENGTGTVPITDRAKLATFFNFLAAHNNQHKYLLCDIRFTEKSNDDSLLQQSIKHLRNYVFPSHINKPANAAYPSVINIKQTGFADYVIYEALFSKMMLDSRKFGESLPLKMYEETDAGISYEKKYHQGFWGLRRGESWMPNSLFPRFYVLLDSVKDKAITLNTILKMIQLDGEDFYNNMIRDKIIVMGDFENDVQPTAIGKMPGTLVLFNSYLTLQHNNNNHYKWYLFFLFVCFFGVSYYFFWIKSLEKKFTSPQYPPFVRRFFAHNRLFWLLLAVSIMSAFFGSRCSVLWFLLYFFLLEIVQKVWVITKKIFT